MGVITHLPLANRCEWFWRCWAFSESWSLISFVAVDLVCGEDLGGCKKAFNHHWNADRFSFWLTSFNISRHQLSINYWWFSSAVALSRFRPQTLARSPNPFRDPSSVLSNWLRRQFQFPVHVPGVLNRARSSRCIKSWRGATTRAVSYTHLTLPTKA